MTASHKSLLLDPMGSLKTREIETSSYSITRLNELLFNLPDKSVLNHQTIINNCLQIFKSGCKAAAQDYLRPLFPMSIKNVFVAKTNMNYT